jgi:hypothetical protein
MILVADHLSRTPGMGGSCPLNWDQPPQASASNPTSTTAMTDLHRSRRRLNNNGDMGKWDTGGEAGGGEAGWRRQSGMERMVEQTFPLPLFIFDSRDVGLCYKYRK